MTGLQFVASMAMSLAWPAAVVVAVVLLRRDLAAAIRRVKSLEFPGGRATFATLADYEKMIAAVAKDAGFPEDGAIVQDELAQFTVVEAMALDSPGQAVIDAWGLLEYQLNVVSDRIAPDQPHGWPQVARTLQAWDKWPLIYPAVLELRRLRDYTVQSGRLPSSADAARYVSVAMDVATTLRIAFPSQSGGISVVANERDPGGKHDRR